MALNKAKMWYYLRCWLVDVSHLSASLQPDSCFKRTSRPMSSLIQALISIRLSSDLVLSGISVIAWLHCPCPELKPPKALALRC